MIERMLASDPVDDGAFIVGVRTTGIYCLPSCQPPRKPKPLAERVASAGEQAAKEDEVAGEDEAAEGRTEPKVLSPA